MIVTAIKKGMLYSQTEILGVRTCQVIGQWYLRASRFFRETKYHAALGSSHVPKKEVFGG